MSATVPPPIATPAEPPKPAKKRHTRSAANEFDAPAPAMNARNDVRVPMYMGHLPSVSDSGAMKSGPMAMPRVYRLNGKITASRETEKVSWMMVVAGTVVDEAKVLFQILSCVLRWRLYSLHLKGQERWKRSMKQFLRHAPVLRIPLLLRIAPCKGVEIFCLRFEGCGILLRAFHVGSQRWDRCCRCSTPLEGEA